MLKPKWRCSCRDDIAPQTLASLLTAHQHYRHQLMQRRNQPFTGAYYWVPAVDGVWSLSVWPNAFHEGGEAGHVDVWGDLVYILARAFHIDPAKLVSVTGNCPYGLPRGRVVKMGDGNWGVAHGGDDPTGHYLESFVIDAFCLVDAKPKFFFDEHEQMSDYDRDRVRLALGV
jgi:hypothetical protein